MPHPRRPGSTSRRRVAGQRNRTGSQNSGSRIGLNRPEEEATPAGAESSDVDGSTSGVRESAAEAGREAAGDRAAAVEQDGADDQDSVAADQESGAADEESGAADEETARSASSTVASEGEPAGTGDALEPDDSGEADSDGTEQRFHAVADLPADDRTGTEPADPSGAAEPGADQPTDEHGGADAERSRNTGLVAALLAVTVVLAGLATWFGVEAYGAFYGNRALADQAGTSEVNGQITDGVEKIFSYDFADTGKTERAAKDLLVGRAVGEYEQLFTTVKQQAPIQKLVVTTTVKASSVTRLEGDRAEVLLFVDQNATRTDIGGEPSVGPAQVVISAERHGDQWKIANISQH
ncbi:hypothetical protein [Saccharopolyspora sp. 6V]|uniref:hypothetical protein n=1 Tax=Saccharopolyspora sp. 6V TaxID=2877239 RepID=UPI001CD3C779|nr:hypothetical protein [Saccharopolyspora sp. 6V]MCA1191105.1 hypothetical protein [Saccharopolyspora sp. 6V]